MNRTENVSEVNTFMSSIIRKIFGDVTSNYYVFSTIWNFSMRWRVTCTSFLYPRIGHGAAMNRTGKVPEVTAFMSSILRRIFGDVRSNC